MSAFRGTLSAVRTTGASGPLRFDFRGDVERGISITQVSLQDGQQHLRELNWMRAR